MIDVFERALRVLDDDDPGPHRPLRHDDQTQSGQAIDRPQYHANGDYSALHFDERAARRDGSHRGKRGEWCRLYEPSAACVDANGHCRNGRHRRCCLCFSDTNLPTLWHVRRRRAPWTRALSPDLIPVGLVLPPLIGALLIAIVALDAPRRAQGISLVALGLSLLAAISALYYCGAGGVVDYAYGGWPAPFGIAAHIDGVGALIASLIAFVALAVFSYAGASLRSELPGSEAPFLAAALLLVAALQGMVATADLFNLYVFLEISSLSAYALIAIGGGSASLAAFRYLLIGTVGASFYLLGVAYLFALTGSLNVSDVAIALAGVEPSAALVAALGFFVVGLGLKMAVFPMHGWLPDAYTYAPSTASALIGGLMTKVSALALLRVLYTVFSPQHPDLMPPVVDALGLLGCIGALLGSVMALAQRDLKRLLAYSSIAHLGLIAVGLSLGNSAGVSGAVFHMLAHGLAKATLFLVAGGVMYRLGRRSLDALVGLHRRMPLSAAAFVVAALSMIGIPPTAGFFSKWYLLVGCLDAGRFDYFAVIVVSTLLSIWYFLRMFETIFFTRMDRTLAREEVPAAMLVPIIGGALAILFVGIDNQFVFAQLLNRLPTLGGDISSVQAFAGGVIAR